MFYCEDCRVSKSWPSSWSASQGRCEVCGKIAVCYDVASSRLPSPPPLPPPKTPEIRKLYAVNQGDDDRHAGTPCWFFDDRGTAEQVASGRGWYGGNAPVSEHNAIIVGGLAYLLARVEPVALNETPEDKVAKKQAALAKLTDEEKKLLNLG